jgi:hypothetical protein
LYAPGLPGRVVVSVAEHPEQRVFNYSFSFSINSFEEKAGLVLFAERDPAAGKRFCRLILACAFGRKSRGTHYRAPKWPA